MVRYMDKQVGRLIDALEQLGLREKTIVVWIAAEGMTRHAGWLSCSRDLQIAFLRWGASPRLTPKNAN